MTKATNNIEIRILGQRRSGNHAIIAWLHDLYPDRSICFLNNIRHGDYDPFENHARIELTGIDESTDTETLRKIYKDVLIYSYEDSESLEVDSIDFVSSVFNESFERKRESYLGKSEHRFDVNIIRDPFNCLASRLVQLRKKRRKGGLDNINLIKDNWKVVANKVLHMKKNENSYEIVINYNKWICDKSYQKKLSKRLMGHYSIASINDISLYGGGSSFERKHMSLLTFRDLVAKWHKMLSFKRWIRFNEYLIRFLMSKKKPDEFLTRWQKLSNDEEYRALFVDREIIELSESIFGEIPGTREFVKEVCGDVLPLP